MGNSTMKMPLTLSNRCSIFVAGPSVQKVRGVCWYQLVFPDVMVIFSGSSCGRGGDGNRRLDVIVDTATP